MICVYKCCEKIKQYDLHIMKTFYYFKLKLNNKIKNVRKLFSSESNHEEMTLN